MRDPDARRRRTRLAALASLGLCVLSTPAGAGVGRLLSPWMSGAPAIDGELALVDWNAARQVDLGNGVAVLVGNDARTLYLGVLDANNAAGGPGDFVALHFDDEGGPGPILDDGLWGNSGCQMLPDHGEGNFLFASDQGVSYQEVTSTTNCPPLTVTSRVGFRTVATGSGLAFEIAIPLHGRSPLQAAAGERFGLRIQVYRDGTNVACLPACAGPQPADFRNLVLASGGCNTGVHTLDAGLPLDWTPAIFEGSGTGWQPAGPSGDPVSCDQNDTGGSGSSACVSNLEYTAIESQADLHVPFPVPSPLPDQATVAVRFRGRLEQGALFDSLLLQATLADATVVSLLTWQQTHGGEMVEVTLDLAAPPFSGEMPIDLIFSHFTITAGGVEGGFAQVDDVEIRCGPGIFSDGFESGLTTHWSGEAP